MKKVLIGCGVVFLLFIVVVGGLTVWGVSKANQWAKTVEAAGKKMETIRAQYPFTEPADATLDPERTAAYFKARNAIMAAVAQEQGMKDFLAAVNTPQGQQPQSVNPFGMVFGMMGAIPRLIDVAAAEFENAKMGPDEFQYHTRVVYLTLAQAEIDGKGGAAIDAIISDIDAGMAKMNKNGQSPTGKELQSIAMQIPDMPGISENLEENLKAIEPHAAGFKTGENLIMDLMFATGDFKNGQFQMNQNAMQQIGEGAGDTSGEEAAPEGEPAPAGN